ncbi:MAG: TIGR00341 family protein [Halobacteria archaeon]|nr:TIGR00341 family protein [Halobacteria archaeon]
MRIIEVIADAGHLDTLTSIAEQHSVVDMWEGLPGADGRVVLHMLVDDASRQQLVDALQGQLGSSANSRIVILPIEATLPRSEPALSAGQDKAGGGNGQTREELYNDIERGARLDSNFLLMVFLSTIVASIGLIENNVAVVIGAMVIAPLLGPNVALAFATSLGDNDLIWKSLRTNLTGLTLTLAISVVIGAIWPDYLASREIMMRTDVPLDSVVLALASGAAAVLSLTTGLSSALVGVMVAVALLPPATALGMLLGSGQFSLALGAGLLLAVNIVCINLSAKLMFLYRGVRPRTWLEKRKAHQSIMTYMAIWIVMLALLVIAVVLRQQLVG